MNGSLKSLNDPPCPRGLTEQRLIDATSQTCIPQARVTGPAVAALCAAFMALGGCATTPADAPAVTSTDQVTACRYVDDVVGSSGLYGAFASQGIENARAEALNKARAAGATHVVWQPSQGTFGSTTVAAKAYRC